ncbi:MAG TPA: DoxX-like family protein [Candidatus Paceibacterota bacterium]
MTKQTIERVSSIFSRLSLFVIYFWFGILKLFDMSPANPMVESLQHATLPFVSWNVFIVCFAIFEMIIGVLFLIPRIERATFFVFILHMIMTTLPLVLLPDMVWTAFFAPTLEGQYIIKNLALVALAYSIIAETHSS